MNIEIRKLTPNLAEDYVRFFDETPHNAEFKVKCYCVIWRSDAAEGEGWPNKIEDRKAAAIERIKNGHIQGYLAYHDNKIVGWCSANTKSECKKVIKDIIINHMNAPVEDCNNDEKIKFIFCFTIAPEYRRKGIASQLLEYICNDAKADGYNYVEVSTTKEFSHDGFMGVFEMYKKHGFDIYAETQQSVVMRKNLKI